MTVRVLTFRVGDRWCAIDIAGVREVLSDWRVLDVPLAPSPVAGLVVVRGEIVTAVDLAPAGGGSGGPLSRDAVVLDGRSPAVAVVVDEIGDVMEVAVDEGSSGPSIVRLADGEPVLRVDPSHLLAGLSPAPSEELVR
jgi:purine-binding chemotaxis protein CheW